MSGYLALILCILCFANISNGDIRCHCNQPICVRTGYMCKSSGASAACFLEHSGYANVDVTSDISRQHGCIELLPPHMRDMCEKDLQYNHNNQPNRYHANKTIICCSEDMCNYVKNVDINIKIQTKTNETLTGTYSSSSANSLPNSIWFQVTVITVPIAGSIVLVMLIFTATRVLRQDSKRQRQRAEIRKQRQFKTHLLLNGGIDGKRINNHDSNGHHIAVSLVKPDKNQTNSKVNDLEKCDMNSGNNMCNINLSYKDDNSNNDQINGDKDSLFVKPINNSLYSSLLSCGK